MHSPVKPLEWTKIGDDLYVALADAAAVSTDGDGWGIHPKDWPNFGPFPYPTKEAAMARVQELYEERVLSDLTDEARATLAAAQPAEDAQGECVSLVWDSNGKFFQNWTWRYNGDGKAHAETVAKRIGGTVLHVGARTAKEPSA